MTKYPWRLLGNNAQYIRFPFDDFLQDQKRMGMESADLTLQSPHIYIDSEEYEPLGPIKEKLRGAGLSVRCVTPMPYRYSICAEAGTMSPPLCLSQKFRQIPPRCITSLCSLYFILSLIHI